MAQIISPNTKLPTYVKPDDKSAEEDLTNELPVTEPPAADGSPDPDSGEKPEDLLSGQGKSWSQWAVDQVKYAADGVASKSLSDELLPKPLDEGEDKTWSQWATENAAAAKSVAAQNVQYYKDAAVSRLPTTLTDGEKRSVTQTVMETGLELKDTLAGRLGYAADQSSKHADDAKMSVQDVIDRYSTTTRTPVAGQQSVTHAIIDTGLGLKDGIATHLGYGPSPDTPAGARAASVRQQTMNRANTLRDSAVSVVHPNKGDKDLSMGLTEALSNLPSLVKERVWASSGSPKAGGGVGLDHNTSTTVDSSSSTASESSTTRPAGGLVNRVAGVVSSATGVVSSYLPTTVTSYLPGNKPVQPAQPAQHSDSSSEANSSTEVDSSEPRPPPIKKSG